MFRIKRLLLPNLKPSTIPIRYNLLALACSLGLIFGAGMSLNAMQARLAEDGKWFLAGSNKKDYVLSVDENSTHGGRPSQTITCVAEKPEGFGTIMQNFVPTEYLGKRVRMSAWVKTNNVTGWAGLWMRVDGAQNGTRAFDNMAKRPIKGTIDWKRFEVVLDVAQDAKNLAFGLLMGGPGQVWLNDLQFEAVDSSVAVTDTAGGPTTSLPPEMNSKGWFLAGSHPADYVTSLDPTAIRDGKPARLLASKAEECKGFGTLMQQFKCMEFLGKRVRLTAWVKSDNVMDWAGVWMRVDGPNGGSTAFDNMKPRPIKGSTDWNRYQIVLDVAPDSSAIALGILVDGKGKVWMSEPMLEVVDASIPVTDLNK